MSVSDGAVMYAFGSWTLSDRAGSNRNSLCPHRHIHCGKDGYTCESEHKLAAVFRSSYQTWLQRTGCGSGSGCLPTSSRVVCARRNCCHDVVNANGLYRCCCCCRNVVGMKRHCCRYCRYYYRRDIVSLNGHGYHKSRTPSSLFLINPCSVRKASERPTNGLMIGSEREDR